MATLIAPSGALIEARAEAVDKLLAAGFKVPTKAATKKKADLLDEVAAECTNAELAEAVANAKKSPAKPKRKKA